MDTHADLDALPYGTKITFHSASKGKKSAFAPSGDPDAERARDHRAELANSR